MVSIKKLCSFLWIRTHNTDRFFRLVAMHASESQTDGETWFRSLIQRLILSSWKTRSRHRAVKTLSRERLEANGCLSECVYVMLSAKLALKLKPDLVDVMILLNTFTLQHSLRMITACCYSSLAQHTMFFCQHWSSFSCRPANSSTASGLYFTSPTIVFTDWDSLQLAWLYNVNTKNTIHSRNT